MTVLLWIYFISMAIAATFAFTNKEARGVNEGKVTLSTIASTLLMAVIPFLNTIFIIGSIYANWVVWRMARRMS